MQGITEAYVVALIFKDELKGAKMTKEVRFYCGCYALYEHNNAQLSATAEPNCFAQPQFVDLHQPKPWHLEFSVS